MSQRKTQKPSSRSNIIGGYTYTPTTSGIQVSRGGWSFEIPTQSQVNPPIVDNNTNTINYDTNYIRGFRGQGQRGYRDVDSYLTWLENNKDSDDYKLFMQNGYFDNKGNLDQGQIREMLTSQGIRGNLGRRDSGRLGNVLTRLRNQSTVGTPEHDQFMQGAVNQFNATKQLYTPTKGKYAGRTFKDLQYNPNATKKGEEISFVGDTGKTMSGWFEPPTQSQTPIWWTNLLKQRGLNNLIIGSNNTGGYNIATPPYFGFNRTLY